MVKRISSVLADDGFTKEIKDMEYKARAARFEAGMEKGGIIYIPAGLTRIHLLALCSLTYLPIYMGGCDRLPFNASNQSYGHTLNGHDNTCPTEKGLIEAIEIFDCADHWTGNSEQMMSVEEVLYTIFVNRENDFSPDVWCPKEGKIVINCRGEEALVYYAGTGWEIKDYIDGEKGLERKFISLE